MATEKPSFITKTRWIIIGVLLAIIAAASTVTAVMVYQANHPPSRYSQLAGTYVMQCEEKSSSILLKEDGSYSTNLQYDKEYNMWNKGDKYDSGGDKYSNGVWSFQGNTISLKDPFSSDKRFKDHVQTVSQYEREMSTTPGVSPASFGLTAENARFASIKMYMSSSIIKQYNDGDYDFNNAQPDSHVDLEIEANGDLYDKSSGQTFMQSGQCP